MSAIILPSNPAGNLTGKSLKIIACLTMFIDHFAASVWRRYFAACGVDPDAILNQALASSMTDVLQSLSDRRVLLYLIMRGIGRLAFPIFCFLLVEGFYYTRDRKKYLLRLLAFGLISEIPFDLALFDGQFSLSHNNVYFTLFYGLLAVMGVEALQEMLDEKNMFIARGSRRAVILIFDFFMMSLASAFGTDYGAAGVAAILIIYHYRISNQARGFAWSVVLLGIMSSPLELLALSDLCFLKQYNGRRGKQHKYFFYLFYPGHLLLLWLVCLLMGI